MILVEDLAKTFTHRGRETIALAGVSFSLAAGELVGYIGPNGAGKSTTIKILAGILVPDRGRVTVDGRVPWKERIEHVRRIGVVFGQRTQLWWDLPVAESFEMLRHIYKVPVETFRAQRTELVELLDLGDILDKPVRQLSLGQRMRADLAASLVPAPSILFLDEPTIGLDAISKLAVRAFVKRINRERGVTVILTTHDMDDIEALCERVIVIGDGKIRSDGSLAALRATVSRERWLTIEIADGTVAAVGDSDATVISREGERVCLAFDPEVVSPAELIRRISSRHAVRDLFVEHPPIETIIAKLYST